MSSLMAQLQERDKAVRTHHEFRTGRTMPVPATLEGLAALRIAELEAAMRRAADIIDRNWNHQAEKLPDASAILREALAK